MIVLSQSQPVRPNVVLIITDDQGYGDLGCTGNIHVQTPAIDQLARESMRFLNFYVSPVSAPTRSSLMTGRYAFRTGIRDTYNGGAIMAASEVTIAEMLKQANYRTGIFGKWHLGDNYPSRPNDQGFDESLIHLSGGMGQPGDITTFFRGDSSYFDPVLWHNGKKEKYPGYCTDIFAGEAIKFIEENKNTPFFCYLAFNAPHTPLQVPRKYYDKYKLVDPSVGYNNPFNHPMSEKDKEDARKVYAMVDNIDENLGKLFRKLDDLKLSENTIIIFMTDNGPQQNRYVAGMRGLKGSVYRGGVRVPFFLKYPAAFKNNKDILVPAAHIDILPTLADLCQVSLPSSIKIDGKNLLPVMQGKNTGLAERSLFFQWSRRYPELYNNIAVQKSNLKLVGNTSCNADVTSFELYDLEADPFEKVNMIGPNTQKATELKQDLDSIINEIMHSPNLINQPQIIIGSEKENPLILNRNDAFGEAGIWDQELLYGQWRVKILEGTYTIRVKFMKQTEGNGKFCIEAGTFVNSFQTGNFNGDYFEIKNVYFPEVECNLTPYYQKGKDRIFPFWIEFERTK